MTATLPLTRPRRELWDGPVIDVDVHANVPSIDSLYPYMEPLWVDWCIERNYRGPGGAAAAYPPGSPRSCRSEWRPANNRPPASSLALLQEHILDPWEVDFAILNCYYGVDSLRHPDWAAALARAVNDWVMTEWLAKDSRLRASITIPARDPAAMVQEIERVGDHPGFVQVLLPIRNDQLWGQRHFHPVFKAMEARNLVAGLHAGRHHRGGPVLQRLRLLVYRELRLGVAVLHVAGDQHHQRGRVPGVPRPANVGDGRRLPVATGVGVADEQRVAGPPP